MPDLSKLLEGISYLKDEPMNRHTTFKIGGNADFFVCPKTPDELIRVLNIDCKKFILGNGSNVLFPDEGFRGMVVKYDDSEISVSGNKIICGASALMSKVSSVAYQNSLAGLEFASGIPGTIGGGVRMNAGAYGGSLDQVVLETEYIENGEIKTISGENHNFSYRHSIFCDEPLKVITKVTLELKNGNKQVIKALIDDYTNRRKTKQPLMYPSAGSVFKRPEGYFAGSLIEQSGLKGYSVGGAEVSSLHAGFIVNKGGATAEDVKNLISHIQKTVMEKFGVALECEVLIVKN